MKNKIVSISIIVLSLFSVAQLHAQEDSRVISADAIKLIQSLQACENHSANMKISPGKTLVVISERLVEDNSYVPSPIVVERIKGISKKDAYCAFLYDLILDQSDIVLPQEKP